jgi:ABC-2 type transport system permease protein
MVKLFTRKLDNKKDAILILAFSFAIVFLLNLLSSYVSLRVDMTAEKKYSLLKPTKTLIKELKDVVIIKVYLQGNMSSDFKRLQQATKDILTEMRAIGGKKIEYEFIDPITGKSVDEQNAMMQEFLNKGLSPVNEQTGKANESKLTRVFPFAIAVYGGREFPIQLIQSQIGFDKKQTINNSIISLEYNFANAIQKLTQYRPPRVAFTTGHGELSSLELADIQMHLSTLQYQIQTIDLSKTYKVPELFDAIVIAKPLYPFSEVDKYKIDQYVMRGGKVLWLIDPTYAEMDSLKFNPTGQMVLDRNLNLDDMLFKYGVRLNADLVQDINLCNQIPLVVGQMGNTPQTELFPWYYFPLLVSESNHAINKNLDPVAAYFASTIDTIQNKEIAKTILLHTTENSKAVLTPSRVHFGILQQRPNPQYFNQPNLPVAVLLEGEFQSLYKNRLSSDYLAASDTVAQLKFVGESPKSKMIVISDGDIIKNVVRPDSSAYPLGFYPYTNQTFANKDFILNCVQYLVDSQGLLETRNKEVKLRLLNTVRVNDEKTKWQLINVAMPILLILMLGVGYGYWRRKRYGAAEVK